MASLCSVKALAEARRMMLQHRIYDKPTLGLIVEVIPEFTIHHNVHMLVYNETHSAFIEAARLKKGFKP